MSTADAQKSEVHATTADASTGLAAADEVTHAGSHDKAPADPNPRNPRGPDDLRIVSDETDSGGPLVIETSDPALNPPSVPIDPFPSNRTPEIDPPVET